MMGIRRLEGSYGSIVAIAHCFTERSVNTVQNHSIGERDAIKLELVSR